MNVPVLVQRIPNANTPVRLSEVRESRRRYLAGLITGGALLVLTVGLLVLAGVVS